MKKPRYFYILLKDEGIYGVNWAEYGKLGPYAGSSFKPSRGDQVIKVREVLKKPSITKKKKRSK
jgi:hypothetical protein